MCVCRAFKFGYIDYSSHEEAAEMLKQVVTVRGGKLKLGMVDYEIEKEDDLCMFMS